MLRQAAFNRAGNLFSIILASVELNLVPPQAYAAKIPQQCTLVSGALIQRPGQPVFKFKRTRKYSNNNYPLTHTQFYIQSGDGQTYQIVVDNLYYNYLTAAQAGSSRDSGIIADFNRRFALGSSVDACGKIYHHNTSTGVHFVHPSACSQVAFNGFLRINGANITSNRSYCDGCACRISPH